MKISLTVFAVGFLTACTPITIYQLFLTEYDVWNYVILTTVGMMIISMPVMVKVGLKLESKMKEVNR